MVWPTKHLEDAIYDNRHDKYQDTGLRIIRVNIREEAKDRIAMFVKNTVCQMVGPIRNAGFQPVGFSCP